MVNRYVCKKKILLISSNVYYRPSSILVQTNDLTYPSISGARSNASLPLNLFVFNPIDNPINNNNIDKHAAALTYNILPVQYLVRRSVK